MARQVNFQEDLLSDVLFSIPFEKTNKQTNKKNAWIMNLKNLVLDLN